MEPGAYTIRIYFPGSEETALEEIVQVDAGRTVDIQLELDGLDGGGDDAHTAGREGL
jgi:hypothetical protein